MKVYEAVLEQLWGAGVTHFSGMVGSTSAPYASALAAQNRARYVGIRHEQVGASILDATARLSGRPGVLMVHGGAGLLAASLGVAAAALDGTPMVVLSATQERKAMENGWWQTLDVQKPVADFVKFQTRVERPDIQMASMCDKTVCIVLTGPGEPTEYIKSEALKRGVPLMQVRTNTPETAEALNGLIDRADAPACGKSVEHPDRYLDRRCNWLPRLTATTYPPHPSCSWTTPHHPSASSRRQPPATH